MLLAIVIKTAYLIFLAIFILVFSLLSIFLRKVNAARKNNRLTWIWTFILTPFVFIAFTFLSIYCGHYSSRTFNKEDWFNNQKKRYELGGDLMWKLNSDRTKQELIQFIGKPQVDHDTIMTYYLGSAPESFLHSHKQYILLKLVNNKVRFGVLFEDDSDSIPVSVPEYSISGFGSLRELKKDFFN